MRTDTALILGILVGMAATLRLFALLDLLQGGGLVSGPELARRLEVEPRMLRRDLVRLQEIGIPIESERGRHGGYRLRPGYRLPPLMLNDDEAAAVTLALRSARELGFAMAAPAIETASAKIRRVLPASLRMRVQALEEALGFSGRGAVDGGAADGGAQGGVLLELAEGIRRQRRVALRYASRGREPRERTVDAYGLAVIGGRWYLAALDHENGENRIFRVDRILSARVGLEPAPVPPGFDAVAFVSRSLARVPWRWEVELVADASMEEVRRDIPATVAEIEERSDGVLVRLRAEDLPGAARMLAAMPWPFVVLKPVELRTALREHAEALLRISNR
jgi:predicted DNA-binding transcriptional regulator YafY